METKKISTGLNVWLWIVFVVNALSAIVSVIATLGVSAVATTLGLGAGYVVLCVIATLLTIAVVVAIAMMLFAKKKVGLYIFAGLAVLGFIINIITSLMTGSLSAGVVVKSAVTSVIAPAITWALAKKDIEEGNLA